MPSSARRLRIARRGLRGSGILFVFVALPIINLAIGAVGFVGLWTIERVLRAAWWLLRALPYLLIGGLLLLWVVDRSGIWRPLGRLSLRWRDRRARR